MVKKTFEMKLVNGMHARPAGLLVKSIGPLDCTVNLNVADKKINAKSIMGILSGALKAGTMVEVECDGPDEENAMAAIEALFAANFNE